MTTYDRRGFALAYAGAQHIENLGTDGERMGYIDALQVYRTALLKGLEQLFGLTLGLNSVPDGMSALFMVFSSTVRSYAAITRPLAGLMEGGLIHVQLEKAGIDESIAADMDRIARCNDESRAAHLDLLDTLMGAFLGDNADRVVTEEELRAIGVETTPPNPNNYEW